jgi:hypothetical protein
MQEIEAGTKLSGGRGRSALSPDEVQRRVKAVIAMSSKVVAYEFDTVDEEWCEVRLWSMLLQNLVDVSLRMVVNSA